MAALFRRIFLIGASLLLLITPVLMAGGGSSCGPKFQGKCICGQAMYDNRMQYVVNCTDQGFRDTTVLEHLPKQTEVLIFTGNYIEELPWNVFGTITELNALKIVDMSNNHIQEIRGKSYHHVPNVQRLILNHNNLSIAHANEKDLPVSHHHPRVFSNFVNLLELHLTNTFADNTSEQLSKDLHDIFVNSNLTKLIKLHLEQNEISRFKDKRVFCDLPSLRDLYLGDNKLKEINFNILCLKNLRFLDLERNNFETVKDKDLIAMDTLQGTAGRTVNLIVDFTFNKFNCDCTLYPFVEWINATSVSVRNSENYSCKSGGRSGTSLAGKTISSVNVTRCRIQARNKHTSNAHNVTLVFLLVILSSVLVGLIAALLYVSKDRMKKYLTPMLNDATKKVHYTTIKDEEVPEVHV